MPQPINPPAGLAARGGPKIIREKVEMAALLGAVAAVWGEIDEILYSIFNLVTFRDQLDIAEG